ncbi:cytochrome P450 [Russula aff. rugulosa BPL654]|nr:cytochrome P450 [Russula aff. rugulosa BPL654]
MTVRRVLYANREWTHDPRKANAYKFLGGKLLAYSLSLSSTYSHTMRFLLMNTVDALAISLFLYLLVTFRDRRRRKGLPYPPGPPSWPIIGCLFDIPKDKPWIAYTDMSKKYGDIICLRALSKVTVVLSSFSAIKDLLEKRGDYYSDRPSVPIVEMVDYEWPVFMVGLNETWRKERKILDTSLRPGAVVSYRQVMEEKTRELLVQLRANPKDFNAHVNLFQGRLIMSLTFGYDLKDGDKILEAPKQMNSIVRGPSSAGLARVYLLPFLRHVPSWVPYLSYEPLAQKGRKMSERIKNEPIDFVKNALRNGTAAHSLASEHLQELENLVGLARQEQEEVVVAALGSLYKAGLETTVSSMYSLFLALVLFPQVQTRAQAELDLVIGRDRLPTFDDRPRLPYIEAFCKELMRWFVVVPMGLSHLSRRDDVYKGFFIPKGAVMIANAWAILHDPEAYPEPDKFKPERFLNEDGTVRDDPMLSLVFGVGKRICPGRHLVESTLFIGASSILSVFNVTKAKDENGNEIPVKVAIDPNSRTIM